MPFTLWCRCGRRTAWGLGALALAALVYVGAAWTPSHYSAALQLVGQPDARPLLGRARLIRSDELAVLTPYFQIAVRNGFGPRNETSPYREPLKAFWALPIADPGLVFKPQLWGFWLLPPAHAYSLYFFSLAAAFVAGYAILLRQLGAAPAMALAGSLLLFFSHYVQVWWTSNAAAFALAPWPAIAFLAAGRSLWRALALFYATAVWLIGMMYPPFIVAAGSALAVLTLAFRPDAFRLARLLPAAAALLAAGAVTWLYLHDIVDVMRDTVYPGARHAGGGGVPGAMLAAHLFPYLTTVQFRPLILPSNECEIAVVASFLPLAFLIFADHRLLAAYARENPFAVAVLAAGAAAMLAWMTLPVPAAVGRLLLWDLAPGNRMLWGFGLLVTLGLVLLAARVGWRVTWPRVAIFAAATLAAWAVSKGLLMRTPAQGFERIHFDAVVLVPVALAVLLLRRWPHALDARAALLAAFAATSAVTFGTFNPLQPARPIFDPPRIPLIEEARRRAAGDPRGFVAVAGGYGAILNGLGVPAINHVLLMPQLDFFRPLFPELPADEFNRIFNRYAHIVARDVPAPTVPQADVIVVPLARFDLPLRR